MNAPVTVKTWRAERVKADDDGAVTAAFSVFGNIDSDGDVIERSAFADMDGVEVPMSSYNHGSWGTGRDGLPVGKGRIRVEAGRAVFEAAFFDTPAAADTREVLKGLGPLGEWSFGLNVLESSPGVVERQNVRVIKRLSVFEVSPVLRGANPATQTLTVRGGTAPDRTAAALTAEQRAAIAEARARLTAMEADQVDEDTKAYLQTLRLTWERRRHASQR